MTKLGVYIVRGHFTAAFYGFYVLITRIEKRFTQWIKLADSLLPGES